MITSSALASIMPNCSSPDIWVTPLIDTFAHFHITTPLAQAMFIGQTAYESEEYNVLEEDLYYSTNGLLNTFPSYFDSATAAEYADQPEQIANIVYANRMGNGDVSSGDGWTYRGRGLIQITGKYNYQGFAASMNMTLIAAINYVSTTEGAAMVAGWYWNSNDLNRFVLNNDYAGLTRAIQGGMAGYNQRFNYYMLAKQYV